LAPYDCGEKLKAVSRLPETWFGSGSVTGETVTEIGTDVRVPSESTTSEPV
jgi:hypothetical protein